MDMFADQINERQQNDSEMFCDAFATLASILDADFIKNNSDAEVLDALAGLLWSIGLTVPDVPNELTNLEERMDYILRATGAMRRRVELKGDWWLDASGSMLGSTTDGNVIAIMRSGMSGYTYKDKSNRAVKINKKTARNINTDAFCFYRPFPLRKMTLADLGWFMMGEVTPRDIIFVLAASLLVTVVGMLTPFLNKQLFDVIIPAGTKSNILPMAALFTGATIGAGLFSMTRSVLLTRFRDKIDLSVQSATMMRLFSLPTTFFKNYTAGELSNRSTSINTVCQALSSAVLTTGLTALFSFVYIIQMVQYGPALVLPGLATIFVMLVFTVAMVFLRLEVTRKTIELTAKLSGLTYRLFSGIQKIKLAGAEKRAFAKWTTLYAQLAKLCYTPPMFMRISAAVSVLISMSGGLVLYYFAGTSGISPADYMAFNAAFGAVNGAMLALVGIGTTIAELKPSIEMIQPILEAAPEKNDNKTIVTSLSGNIELNGVTFRYAPEGAPILNNISLKIRSGEYVAIVGKTGCGKSTLLRLLLGFETPETGAIYYDGQDLQNLDATSTRQRIGVSLQNGQLFSGDIFSNIIITAPHKTLEDAWEAARMAAFDDDIKAMPMGMHTVISEGGGGISGGQRQRLLIARALVAKPKILFFDEATSALDNITQKHVSDSISSLKCTRLVIAHRLSTIKQADRIIVLDEGKIVEDGNYEELVEKGEIFYELTKRQII